MEFNNQQPFSSSASTSLTDNNPFLFANELPPLSPDFSNFNYDIWGFPLLPLQGSSSTLLEIPLMESFPTQPLDIPSQDVLPEGFCNIGYGDESSAGVGFGYKEMELGFEERKEVNILRDDSMNTGVQPSSNSSSTTISTNPAYDYEIVMMNMETSTEKGRNMKVMKRCRSSSDIQITDNDTIFAVSSTFLSYETISKYFYMPITQAARELNVGLTLLKKRCRELGIPRWPHRKLMSLQTLIKNVQELEKKAGNGSGRMKIRDAVKVLENQKKLIEEMPGIPLEENTRRLRQACFKANYKKRRLMADQMAMDHHHHQHHFKSESC
ncbi:hypothetical protein C5167_031097 [Papaver somniferum]|nr:hypothetical protein C5167_031097 [Papaver somniferum]